MQFLAFHNATDRKTLTTAILGLAVVLVFVVQTTVWWLGAGFGFGGGGGGECSALLNDPMTYGHSYNHRTVLASYPRSGNSFLRNLVERSTRHYTTSVNCDPILRQRFTAECNHTDAYLRKHHYGATHNAQQAIHEQYTRVVHLVRNPIDVIVSFQNFRMSRRSHTAKITSRQDLRMSVRTAEFLADGLRRHYEYWANTPKQRLLMRYEDLRIDPETELRRLVRFLENNDDGDDHGDAAHLQRLYRRVRCVSQDTDFQQAYNSPTSRNRFMYGLKYFEGKEVQRVIDLMGGFMCQLGYDEHFFGLDDPSSENSHWFRAQGVQFNCSLPQHQGNFTTRDFASHQFVIKYKYNK